MGTYSFTAVLSAVDNNFSKTILGANKDLNNLCLTAKKVTNSILDIATGTAAFDAVSTATTALTRSLDEVIKRFDTLHNFPQVLEQIAIRTDLANGSIEQIADGMHGIPTAIDDIGSSMQSIALVTENLKQATSVTIGLNTAMLALGASSTKASANMGSYIKMLQAAKAEGARCNSVVNVMGTSMYNLATIIVYTGAKPLAELYDSFRKGHTPMDDFTNKIMELSKQINGLSDQTKAATGGIVAAVETMKSSVLIGMRDIIIAVDKTIKASGFPQLEGIIKNASKGIGLSFKTIKAGLGVFDIFPKDFKKVADASEAMMKKVKGVSKSVTAGFSSIATKVGKFTDFLSKKFYNVSGFLKSTGDKIGGVFSSVNSKVGDTLKGVGASIKGFASNIPGVSGVSKWFLSMQAAGAMQIGILKDKYSDMFGKLSDVAGKALKGLTNILGTALKGLASSLNTVMSVAMKAVGPAAILGLALVGLGLLDGAFGEQITNIIDRAIEEGPHIIQGLIDGIVTRIPDLINTGAELLVKLLDAITANLPTVIHGGIEILNSLIQGVITAIPNIIPAVINVITTFINTVIEALPKILIMGLDLLLALVQGIMDNIPLLVQSSSSIISTLLSTIFENLPTILSTGIQIIFTLIQGIIQMLPTIVSAGFELIVNLLSGILRNLPEILASGVMIIGQLVTGVYSMLKDIFKAGWEIVKTLALGILKAIPELLKEALGTIGNLFGKLFGRVKNDASDCTDETTEEVERLTDNVTNSYEEMGHQVTETTTQMGVAVSEDMHGMSDSALTSAYEMQTGVLASTQDMSDGVITSTAQMSDEVQADMEYMSDTAVNSTNQMSDNTVFSAKNMQSGVSSEFKSMSDQAMGQTDIMATNVDQSLKNISTNGSESMAKLNQNVSASSAEATNNTASDFKKLDMDVNASMHNLENASKKGLHGIQSAFTSAFDGMLKGVQSSMSNIEKAVAVSLQTIMHGMGGLEKQTPDIGKQAMVGLANGIINNAHLAISAANRVANQISDTMRKALDIHSPSRVTREIGRFVSKGAELGILDHVRDVQKASQELAVAMYGQTSNKANDINHTIERRVNHTMTPNISSTNRIVEGLSEAVGNIQIQVTSLLNGRVVGEETTPTVDRVLKQRGILENRGV